MSIFKGSGVAIVTPMRDNGEVDYEGFAKLLEFQIAEGTDAIIVCGTTGESSTLTLEEHAEVIRYCVKTVAGRIPVVAGTGSNCTETAIHLSKEAQEAGADGLLLVNRCADPWSHKTVRASMGACFRLPVWELEAEELAPLLKRSGLPLYAAALGEGAQDVRCIDADRCALAIGNEGQGLSQAVLAAGDALVKIPMRPRCESLNAAAAAAVLLWELARRA